MNTKRKLHSAAQSPHRYALLALMAVTTSALSGGAHAENEARYLYYKNCGGYVVDEVKIQEKVDGSWEDAKGGKHFGGIDVNQGVCFDPYDTHYLLNGRIPFYHLRNTTNQLRLQVKISGGETENCDSTNFTTDDDGDTRVMKMEGTSFGNNGCRSQGYRDWGDMTNQCDGNGEKLLWLSC
nr:hypothetical protein [Hyphomonas sp. Mor2]